LGDSVQNKLFGVGQSIAGKQSLNPPHHPAFPKPAQRLGVQTARPRQAASRASCLLTKGPNKTQQGLLALGWVVGPLPLPPTPHKPIRRPARIQVSQVFSRLPYQTLQGTCRMLGPACLFRKRLLHQRKFASCQMLMTDFCFSAEYFVFVSIKIFDTKNPSL